MKKRVRALVAAIIAGGTVVYWPIGAAVAGNSTCTYDSNTKRVTVEVHSSDTQVVITRSGSEIRITAGDCGAATRFNTNKVVVNDPASHDVQAFVHLHNGPLKPGFRNEPGRSDEIELEFNLSDGTNAIRVQGSQIRDYLTAGQPPMALVAVPAKINLNANEQTGIDADVLVTGNLDHVTLQGFFGGDRMSAQGGVGTGEALPGQVFLWGFESRDTLIGGDGSDTSYGGTGADTIRGKRGPDELYGEEGNDDLNGGPGADVCDGGGGTNTLENCELP